MTPIRLKMQAFGPYQGAVEIAFSGLRGKLFLITGSTGGGKTTILDAICFALFCRATGGRRTWQDMRNLSAGEDVPTMVDFEFSLGEEQYRFQRSWRWHKVRGSGRMEMRDEHQCSRRNGEQWELLASGAESRVREYAQRLLGLTCEQFSQVIVLPQGEFRKLLLSNSTEKSKIFQTLFQTEKWERITKCAQSMAEDLEQRCGGLLSARQAVLESEGVQASEELELLRKATEEEYEQSIAAVKTTENDLENISNILQKVNRLKETETVFRRLQKQLAQAAAEKRALEQKRQEAVKAAAGLARLEEEKAAGLQLAAKHQEQMETLTKLKSLAAEKERLEKEIASQKEQRLEWEQKALSAAENVERGRAYLRELNDKLKALPEASRSFQELKTAFELLKQWEEGRGKTRHSKRGGDFRAVQGKAFGLAGKLRKSAAKGTGGYGGAFGLRPAGWGALSCVRRGSPSQSGQSGNRSNCYPRGGKTPEKAGKRGPGGLYLSPGSVHQAPGPAGTAGEKCKGIRAPDSGLPIPA